MTDFFLSGVRSLVSTSPSAAVGVTQSKGTYRNTSLTIVFVKVVFFLVCSSRAKQFTPSQPFLGHFKDSEIFCYVMPETEILA